MIFYILPYLLKHILGEELMRNVRTFLSILAVVCVVLAGTSTLFAEGNIDKEKNIKAHKIIRLHYVGGISPGELTVAPGTTVIWVNDSRAPVELQFEGKQVTVACKSPVHFVVDDQGSFVSDRIPQGSVASLCFVEKGEFPYVLRKAPQGSSQDITRDKEFRGKVVVK